MKATSILNTHTHIHLSPFATISVKYLDVLMICLSSAEQKKEATVYCYSCMMKHKKK